MESITALDAVTDVADAPTVAVEWISIVEQDQLLQYNFFILEISLRIPE
tara:strand:+ start:250 stop:396 length:147 start_codon:yes stop_codon:yes gene_type:complete